MEETAIENTENKTTSNEDDKEIEIKEPETLVAAVDDESKNVENPITEQEHEVIENETINDDNTDGEGPSDKSEVDDEDEGECSDRTGSETDDDDASVVVEREEGDGQESVPNRKVDDDEDKRNPQYIPKRGTFYEHDDRTAVEEGEEETEKTETERTEKEPKKKVWLEKEASKWNHDRFNDQEQAPKSRAELVQIYGYDIRNEDGPPRARRRRRYGRGPNKYTRNWEDVDAYSKPTNVSAKPPPRKTRSSNKNDEEFPPLHQSGTRNPSSERSGGDNDSNATNEDPIEDTRVTEDVGTKNRDRSDYAHDDAPPVQQQQQPNDTNRRHQDARVGNSENGFRQQQQQHLSPRRDNRMIKGSQKMNEQIRASPANIRGVTKTRGFFKNGGRGSDLNRARNQKNQRQNAHDSEYTDYILSQNFTNKSVNHHQQQQQQQQQQQPQQSHRQQHQQQNVQKLEKEMANMSVQQNEPAPNSGGGGYTGVATRGGGKFNRSSGGVDSGGSQRQTSVPPRLQGGEQRGSKRYSSLRQRSLPETTPAPGFNQHPTYYQAEYGQQPIEQQPPQQGLLPHPTSSIHSQVPPPTNNNQQLITVAPTNQPIATLQAHQGPPANGAPLMPGPPPQFAPTYPPAPPPAFLQAAGVAPPPFIAQQPPPPPQIINFGQPGYPQPPGYTNFQHQQFTPVNQGPAELYQSQSGITYYSTQNQQVVQRAAPPKRVKAAIPIVPPPEHKEPRGRGRLNQGEDSPVGGSTPETAADDFSETLDNTNSVTYQSETPVAVQQ